MSRLLDRYLAGQCVGVWRDLTALGPDVRHKRYCADASAVAAETMRRARHNVETLIQRLDARGYRFLTMNAYGRCRNEAMRRGLGLSAEVTAKMHTSDRRRFHQRRIVRSAEFQTLLAEQAEQSREAMIRYLDATVGRAMAPWKDPNVFSPPGRRAAKEVDGLEKAAGGPVPMSLRAWYEQVGGVSLLGWHSVLSPNPDEPQAGVYPDPLMVAPLTEVVRQLRQEEFERDAYVCLAPDDRTKAGEDGRGPYGMRVPNDCADAMFGVVGKRKGPWFVNYLRNAFRWGGFPGWEGRKGCPEKVIAELGEGLVEI